MTCLLVHLVAIPYYRSMEVHLNEQATSRGENVSWTSLLISMHIAFHFGFYIWDRIPRTAILAKI